MHLLCTYHALTLHLPCTYQREVVYLESRHRRFELAHTGSQHGADGREFDKYTLSQVRT